MNDTSETLTEINLLSKNRQAFYQFLSRIFEKEVDNELLTAIRDKKNFLSQPIEGLDKNMTRGLELVNGYLDSSSKKSSDEICLELAVEYAGLFLGVWGKPPHPSESIYGSVGGLVMQKERDEVLILYNSAGLVLSKNFREPEDHVAIELQFMSYLAGETAVAANAHDQKKVKDLIEMQGLFLKKHLGKWLGFMTHDVMETGHVDFYKGICLLTQGFVDEDLKTLKDLPEFTQLF